MIAALTLLAAAQPVPDDTEMQAEIARRDVMIASLVERVERLEAIISQQPISSAPAMNVVPDLDLPLDVERALEMVLVEDGARLISPGAIELMPSVSWSTRSDEIVGIAMIEDRMVALTENIRASDTTIGMSAKIGLPSDFQAEVYVPYRFADRDLTLSHGGKGLDSASVSADGFGDIRVSLAKAITASDGRLPLLIARLSGDLGNANRNERGLSVGGGFASISGSITAVEQLDPLVFVGSVRYARGLTETGIDPGDSYGFSLGTYLAAGPETSLRFLFDYGHFGSTRIDDVTLPASSGTIANLSVGASISNGPSSLIDVSASVGLTPESPDFTLSLAVPWRL